MKRYMGWLLLFLVSTGYSAGDWGAPEVVEEDDPYAWAKACPRVLECIQQKDYACLVEEAPNQNSSDCLTAIVGHLGGTGNDDALKDIVRDIAARDKDLAQKLSNWGLRTSTMSDGGSHANVTKWIKFYLEMGADPNYHKDVDSPLFSCAKAGNTDCVRVLLDAGALVESAYNSYDALTLYQEMCISVGSLLYNVFSRPERGRKVGDITIRINALMALPEIGQSKGIPVFCREQEGRHFKDVWWANWPLYVQRMQEGEQSPDAQGDAE